MLERRTIWEPAEGAESCREPSTAWASLRRGGVTRAAAVSTVGRRRSHGRAVRRAGSYTVSDHPRDASTSFPRSTSGVAQRASTR
nr:MAG: hypothetical protein DIU78_00415 [Pseudomonadota bacterium]